MAKQSAMEAPDMSSMDELYKGGGDEEAKGGEEKASVDEEAAQGAKALVPLTVLQSGPGDKVAVGDERVVKVMAIHGDEAEVIYAPKEGEEKEESGPAELDRMDHEEEQTGNPGPMKGY